MKHQNKNTVLEERITASGIYEALELLRREVSDYCQSNLVTHCCYVTIRENTDLAHQITGLENQLQELISQSREWERLE